MELNPWERLSEERLKQFLADPKNNENAPDRKLVATVPCEPKILDVGSGTGHQYLALKQLGWNGEYLGVDKTQKMVEFARRRFPEAMFIQGDIHRLPFPDRSWPIVYCRHVLVHLPGYEKALTELARVCADCLIICLLNPLADKQQIRVIGKPPGQIARPNEFSEHYLNIYSRGPFEEMVKNLGFNIIVDDFIEVGGYFKNYEVIIARRMPVAPVDTAVGEIEGVLREQR